jgi:hypothetical protein
MDAIHKAIEHEIGARVQDALNRYAKYISETHRISLALLLRDIPVITDEVGVPGSTPAQTACLGLTQKGTRCTSSGKFSGYCAKHHAQCQKIQPIRVHQSGPVHNHGVPPLFKDDCPACQSCALAQSEKKKVLIDFRGIL